MTEQTDTGPAYTSNAEGLRQAAGALEDQREAERGPAPPPAADPVPQLEGEDYENVVFDRNQARNQVFHTLQEARQQLGRSPMDAKTAGQLLAVLRQEEQQAAAQQAADQDLDTILGQQQQAEALAAQPQEAPEVTAARQQAEAERHALSQERSRFISMTTQLYGQAVAEAQRAFPDVQSFEDAARLAQTDPARYARLVQTVGQLTTVRDGIMNADTQQRAEHSQQFHAYAKAEDSKFFEKFPELNDRAKLAEAGTNTVNALKSFGLSEDDIASAYNNQTFLRDSRVQAALYELGKMHAARESVRSKVGRVNNIPPVQRPGVRGSVRDTSEYNALSQRLGNNISLKEAAKLRSAQVRAAAKQSEGWR